MKHEITSDGLINTLWAFQTADGDTIASGSGPCDLTLRLSAGEYVEVFTASNYSGGRTTTERSFTVTDAGRIQWHPVPGSIDEEWEEWE